MPTDRLYAALLQKNPQGFSQEEAIQIFLWLYCTVDILPEHLRDLHIGRNELEATFQQLAREGFISSGPTSDELRWDGLINALLSQKIDLDLGFRDRISQYF